MFHLFTYANELEGFVLDKQKDLCQFFSNESLACFLSDFINLPNISKDEEIKLLDAGAGDGILSFAAVLKLIKLGYKNIDIKLYEIDSSLHKIIKSNLNILKIQNPELNLNYTVIKKDFLKVNIKLIKNHFDLAVINPPYKKNKHSFRYDANKVPLNISNDYASFMALAFMALKTEGQLISISPRSFCSGTYFKDFRDYLIQESYIENIHIFKSRINVFKKDSILQENIVCSLRKSHKCSKSIEISHSKDLDFNIDYSKNIYRYQNIIKSQNDNHFIFLPESKSQQKSIEIVENLCSNMEKNEYMVKTGPIVPFRMKKLISNKASEHNIPILRLKNIDAFKINWTSDKNNTYLKKKETKDERLVQKDICILLRRFAPKENQYRIIATVFNPDQSNFKEIAVENHLNIIYKENFTHEEALGLTCILNSYLYDDYFRSLCGSTQINKSELMKLNIPSTNSIKKLGRLISEYQEINRVVVNKQISNILG